ncbi:unnamed protein product [Mesocestoides corti]|uniref:Anti_prolifrtn domain-containing protein n=1 Tax=Mesocestoides corti TaxID=53468 RepID=A0A0R3U6T8_MESCO|nr:unnamed protein product [Mesocestoides corti]
MHVEVSIAVNYLLSHLYTKLPRRRVDNFGEELERCLLRKLQTHWFTDNASQEGSHRYFQTSGPQADFIFAEAAISSGLDWSEIQACLPAGLVISIDPGHVACQYGSNECSTAISNSAWGGSGFNSASLSSSGCSSASSVSSNGSSGSWSKTKHQVLYSVNPRSVHPHQLAGEKDADAPPTEVKKHLDDAQKHLATEAALSVLTEPEELQSTQNGEFPHVPDHPASRNNNESISGVGDSHDLLDKTASQVSSVKNSSLSSTDPTGDGSYFEHMSNDSQAKSDIENQYPFSGFHPKGLRHVDGTGEQDLQQFDLHGNQIHQSQHTQPPFNQPNPNFIQRSTSTPSFTAATFAATKFGSTKLKSQAKRPHRLVSPCDAPVSGYPSQLLEAIGQSSIPSNQMPMCDRLVRLNEMHRNPIYGGHGFGATGLESNRANFFGNYTPTLSAVQQLDRPCDASYGSGYPCGFLDNSSSTGLYGTSDNTGLTASGYVVRSSNPANNPVWSQFEKIRNEFQLKNSQYIQQQQQQQQQQQETAGLLNRSPGYPFTDTTRNAAYNAVTRSALQQDYLASINPKSLVDGKYGIGENLALNQDIHDLLASQKFVPNSGSSFCWSQDLNKSPIDASLGQAFNALNISER